jgi:thioredoxin 1
MTLNRHRFINSQLFLLVNRCPPCKVIKPVYEEMSGKYPGVAFGKVDIDDNSDAAVEFKISAVPTFVFFDGDETIQRFSGADSKALESLVKDLDAR